MTRPVLVTGGSGFLGWYLTRALLARGQETHGTSTDGAGLPAGVEPHPLSLDDGGAAGVALIERLRPAAVLHLAALSNADQCAREPERARRVNAEATGRLAAAAAEVAAYFVYTSSDLVFDGTAPPYVEDDPTAPIGDYMATKAAGEQAVLAANPAALVARTTLMYGVAGGRHGCFTDHVLAELRGGEPIRLFQDQHRTPLYVEDAARILCDLLELRPAGLLHLGGPQRVSRFEQGLALADALGIEQALCVPIDMHDIEGLAPRPADVSLNVDKLCGLIGRRPLDVAAGYAALAERVAE